MTLSTTKTGIVVALALLAAPWARAEAGPLTLKEPETGRRFAAERTLDGKPHVCIGVGVREFLVFDVYAAAFYVERDRGRKAFAGFLKRHGQRFRASGGYDYSKIYKSIKLYDWVMWGRFNRVMDTVFVREVAGKKAADNFRKVLQTNLGNLSAPDVKKDVDRFLATANKDFKKGTRMVVHFAANGSMRVTFSDRPSMTCKNPKVARAMLGSWFGRKPISKSLRQSLARWIRQLAP